MGFKSMFPRELFLASLIGLGLIFPASAGALTLPFLEDFVADDARWGTRGGGLGLDYLANGGMGGGGYVSDEIGLELNADGDSIVAFRAQDELNSSGNAFVGNWVGGSVQRFSAMVRHSAAVPLTFFTRFSSPFNFPGATAVRFQPVMPHVWTALEFTIDGANPAFVTFEGSNFATVFGNIGHVQVGFDVPTGFGGSTTPIRVDLDQAAIVPEPMLPVCWWLAMALVVVRSANQRCVLTLRTNAAS